MRDAILNFPQQFEWDPQIENGEVEDFDSLTDASFLMGLTRLGFE